MPPDQTRWQYRLLPLMVGSIIATALFFSVVTIVEFRRLASSLITQPPAAQVDRMASSIPPTTFEQQQQQSTERQMVALEREAIARRYNQGNMLIATRLWTRMMGFVTGMILAFIGAAFVLGKLNEETSELSASGSGAALSLKSASPGIILCVLGTVLMTLSIWVQVEVSTKDIPLYVGAVRDWSSNGLETDASNSPAAPAAESQTEFRGPGTDQNGN